MFAEAMPVKDTLMLANNICGQTSQINITNNTVLLFFALRVTRYSQKAGSQ
jgi:hypothetical protein